MGRVEGTRSASIPRQENDSAFNLLAELAENNWKQINGDGNGFSGLKFRMTEIEQIIYGDERRRDEGIYTLVKMLYDESKEQKIVIKTYMRQARFLGITNIGGITAAIVWIVFRMLQQ